ncbi:MAG: NTP transferase domain-containing protein [Caldisericota bacterium]|nr:NTP transferase domain-containing protein [Caldisericota bacterium]
MEEKINLLTENSIITFKNDGIILSSYGKELSYFKYADIQTPYFSLIILAGRERNLKRVKKIITTYSALSVIREVIIVGNKSQSTDVIAELSNVKFTKNEKPNDPISVSVKKGICLLSNHSEFNVIVFANRKILSEKKMNKFMHIVHSQNIGVAVLVEKGKRTHPIIFSTKALQKIRKVRKEQGIRYFIKKFSREVAL